MIKLKIELILNRVRSTWNHVLYHSEKKVVPYMLRLLAIITVKARKDLVVLRASSLSFITILSLVPFLAMVFSVLKGMGVPDKIEPIILNKVTSGSREIIQNIMEYIERTRMVSLGWIGFSALILTFLGVFNNVEKAFNAIWELQKGRSVIRKLRDYLSVLLFLPLVLSLSVSLLTTLQASRQIVFSKLAHIGIGSSFLLTTLQYAPKLTAMVSCFVAWMGFSFFYFYMPNTKVPWRPALWGGLVAGIFWQILQYVYVYFHLKSKGFNVIYGAMARLPVFFIWIFISWIILLLGAELVYAIQFEPQFLKNQKSEEKNIPLKS